MIIIFGRTTKLMFWNNLLNNIIYHFRAKIYTFFPHVVTSSNKSNYLSFSDMSFIIPHTPRSWHFFIYSQYRSSRRVVSSCHNIYSKRFFVYIVFHKDRWLNLLDRRKIYRKQMFRQHILSFFKLNDSYFISTHSFDAINYCSRN